MSVRVLKGVTEEEKSEGRIYPRISRIRDISAEVATKVVEQAFKEVGALSIFPKIKPSFHLFLFCFPFVRE